MSNPLTFHNFTESDLAPFDDLQQRYSAVYPCRPWMDGRVYLSPSCGHGQYVQCAAAPDGRLAAAASFYPQGQLAWAHILVEPGFPGDGWLRDQLYAWMIDLAGRLGASKLAFQYFQPEADSIAFLQAKGARRIYSVYTMERPLELPIPSSPVPAGFEIRCLRMQREEEQQAYIDAYSECFPENNYTVAEWQFLVTSPWWAEGACVCGMAGEELAGSVAVYWEPGSRSGCTENVFTRPAFRGQGLARSLLAESLRYLKAHGLEKAQLDVKAENERALNVYWDLGYRVTDQSQVWECAIA